MACPRVAQVIRRRFGIGYHVDHIGRLLRSLGWSPQRPTRRALERDEEGIQRWIKQQWPRIKKARRLRGWLVFIDQSGLLLLPVVRRTWSRRGQTPVLRHRGGNLKKVSAIAAVCVSPNRREVRPYFQLLVDANFNSVAVPGFLKQLTRHFHHPLLLVWDRSKIHRGLHTQVFLDVMDWWQFYLPPYAPDLNPVEYVWSYLKTEPLANLACPDVALLARTARRHARALQYKPALLGSFIRHSPLSLLLC